MELNRDHYFMIGLIVLLLGLQFRFLESVDLNPQTTKFLKEKLQKKSAAPQNPLAALFPSNAPVMPRKTLRPPKWLGWTLISVGAVLVLQSLGMRKPG